MITKTSDTWVGKAPVAVTGKHLESCLVHIYPTGTDMGRRYPLGTGRVTLGRGDGVDILVQDHSVSRTHAVIETTDDGCFILDQKSLNGTHVNDSLVQGAFKLSDGDYIRVGNAIFRFLNGGNIEADYHEEIYRLTIVDGLTHTHNRRYLIEFLDREMARSERHGRPLSVLLFDIDKFKSVNDLHGHLCGDHVLRALSARLRPSVRREDLLARYGGEEFCIVLVETDHPTALDIGERIRGLVAAEPIEFDGLQIPVTISVGVAAVSADLRTPADLLKEADDKLFQAKRTGRNKVVG
jgi:diguanylate cyclase (GGDEF)-like protein